MGIVDYIQNIFLGLQPIGTFIHGPDWEKNLNDQCLFPICYLDDPIYSNDKFTGGGYLGSVYPVKILFAGKSNMDMTTADQYIIIDDMREVSRKFLISVFNDSVNVKSLGNIRRWNAVNLFDLNVSGVYLQMEIELYNTYSNCL